ncbi:polygalacturonase At1g48100-like [Phragmites australis]|uniref:polygalacturonase At1g48100-like n=1 Tax=Phragmites australis TaxID=29695 RepID=UPI002D766E11|nr:polygalacturonase At1g48100-like [Phragmites australis]
MGLRIPNGSVNATFLFVLLVLVTTTFLTHHCLARREAEADHRRTPLARHRPAPPLPPVPTVSPPSSSATFSVTHYGAVGDGTTDDTKAFADAWSAACGVGASTVVVPASYVFLVGPITFTGDSCEANTVFQVDGTILADTGSTAWHSGDVTQWLEFKNVRGLTIQGSGTVDGHGSQWWSGRDGDDDATRELDPDRVGTSNRPTAVRVYQGANVTVTGITIRNSAKFHLTFDTCRDVEVHGVAVSSPGDSPNTDGIHLTGSVGVSIHNTTLACGDDCISIQDGCSDVFIRNVKCGPGHGISIGGLGKGGATAVVSDVSVQDVTLNQTMTGVRIKTWQGGSGSVTNVRFSNVQVSGVKIPIAIDQYYCDHTTCTNQTSAVAVSGVAYQGVAGTYTERPVYLACSDAAPCSGIHLADIQLAPVKDGGYHLHGPFCWKAYGDVVRPVEPPVECLMAGGP